MNSPRICAIIPARLASTRLPEKALRPIAGKPMIQRVYERVIQCRRLDAVYIATDSDKIQHCVESFGGKAIMTSEDCPTGTDRLIEAVSKIETYDVIVNVQGDEPLIEIDVIEQAIDTFLKASECKMGTIATSTISEEEYKNPNNVKVVLNHYNEAMYFSRANIPFNRDATLLPKQCYLHIGLYVYDVEFLKSFGQLKPSLLEETEKLEQLRVLDNGYKISCAITSHRSIGVDTEEDLMHVETLILNGDY